MVSRSNIGRSESTPLRIEPERGKVREDDFKACRPEPSDILNDDQSRLNLGDDSSKLLPEPASFAGDSGFLSGDADVLAREAARDAAHQAPKWASIEGGHIRPNRRWSHVAFFHARSQDFTGVGFPLHVSDDSAADACEFNSHVESGCAAE